MTVSAEPESLEKIASLIRRVFVGNQMAYAEQMPDGRYKAIYRPIQTERILNMLQQGRSMLTYQMAHRRLRWVCFDVDIRKDILTLPDFPKIKTRAQEELVAVVERIVNHLGSMDIPYLIEASGNRGVHIWIIWQEWVPRSIGFAIQQLILDRTNTCAGLEYCAVDRFPPSPASTAKLGKGVKLPLSLHAKSNKYAALVRDIPSLQKILSSLPQKLDSTFAQEQLGILDSFRIANWDEICQAFELEEHGVVSAEPDYLKLQSLLTGNTDLTLEGVLNSLCKCRVLQNIITRYREGGKLSERERTIMVGLLNRLKTNSQPTLGSDLLYEFFSKQPGFKPSLTVEKLRNLNLYPPTCSYLKSRFGEQCCPCETHELHEVEKSPVELIEGSESISEDIFQLTSSDIDVIVRAQMRYSDRNDEVSLHFIRQRLAAIDPKEFVDHCTHYLSVQRSLADYYVFTRSESKDKTRKLVSLSAEDKILSTWFTRIINALFGAEVSSRSFGYRFEASFAKANIYKPWLGQWRRYTKELASIIEDDTYANYWVVALDISSFYDTILIDRLAVKLGIGPSRGCEEILNALDSDSRKKYENITSILLSWCRQIGDKERGVPQGPAFARYLAELYLMQFDQDIESAIIDTDAYYFRYVDDIFLIVRGDKNAQSLNTRLRYMLDELSLAVKEEKAFLGTVSQYRELFRKYQDESKYFIDRVSWNSRVSSSKVTGEAIDELTNLALLPDGEGIQPDNAAFFLTHLRDLPPVQAVRTEIAPHIWGLQYCRGSLFRHMCSFVVPKWRESHFAADLIDLNPLTGLKLEVFLNSLLESIADERLSDQDIEPLRKATEHFVHTVESPVAHILLLQVMLADTRLLNSNFVRSLTPDTIIQAVRYGALGQLPGEIVDRLLDDSANHDISDIIKILYVLMFRNKLNMLDYTRASSIFFAATLEALRTVPSTQSLPCLDGSCDDGFQLLRKYHQLCCFCSVIGRAKEFAALKSVWRALVVATNACKYWRPLIPFWLNSIDEVNFRLPDPGGNCDGTFAG